MRNGKCQISGKPQIPLKNKSFISLPTKNIFIKFSMKHFGLK